MCLPCAPFKEEITSSQTPLPIEPSSWHMDQNDITYLPVSQQEKWEHHNCLPQVKTPTLGLGGTWNFVSKSEGRNGSYRAGSQSPLPRGPPWHPCWQPVPYMWERSSFSASTLRVIAWPLKLLASTFHRGLDPDMETFQWLPNPVLSTVLNVPNPERPGIEKSGAKDSSHY